MTLTRKDAVATGLTGLAVLTYLATHEAWDVPLVGDSHRWAAVVIMALGIAACSVGAKRVNSALFGVLGGAALVREPSVAGLTESEAAQRLAAAGPLRGGKRRAYRAIPRPCAARSRSPAGAGGARSRWMTARSTRRAVLAEELRPNVNATIAFLREQDVEIKVLSGDRAGDRRRDRARCPGSSSGPGSWPDTRSRCTIWISRCRTHARSR